jgi:epoxyqueuosine reductase
MKGGKSMGIEQSIKEHAQQIGMDLCGIAPISRFEGAPEGTNPKDFLPGCRSVVVVGTRLLDGAVQAIMRNFEDGKKSAQGIYGTYGYIIAPNFHLLYSVYDVARHIERETGEAATPTQVGPFAAGMSISQRHAAVAAGLGEFGWLSIVLTPQFGPRNRFGAILTTAALQPDPMYKGPQLCDPGKCNICTTVCPTGALSRFGEKEARRVTYKDENQEKVYEYCHVNITRCRISTEALTKKTGGNQDLVSSFDASLQEVNYAAASKRLGPLDTSSWNCGKCLAYCPAGNWKEKFKDKGFSSRLPVL